MRAAIEELARAHPMTLRQVHYRLVSRPDVAYQNTRAEYNTLSGWLRDARLDGQIPWEWIEDRLRVPRRRPMWQNLDDFNDVQLLSYRREVWQDQQGYVEVWCEKDALSGIFMDVLRPYGVVLNVGRGYDGWSSVKNAAGRYGDGDNVTVLYFGDFDPSGEDISRSLRERLGEERLPNGGAAPDFVRCALNMDDVHRYQLPPDLAKPKDPRYETFVRRHGDIAVELDALPADVLRGRIKDEVESRMDMEALEATRAQERRDRWRLWSLHEQARGHAIIGD